jgi:hypothetical protein
MSKVNRLDLYCKYCDKVFLTNLEQIAHHRSEWHRANIKLLQEGKELITVKNLLKTSSESADLDKYYWSEYYLMNKTNVPSNFAVYINNTYLSKQPNYCIKLLDVGCGNLRDATFFQSNGCSVTGIDNASTIPTSPDVSIIQEDILTAVNKVQVMQDVIYMRFFLHAVPYEVGEKAIQACQTLLKSDGLLCIEVRSTDETNIQANSILKNGAYVTEHSRWLYTAERLKTLLQSFDIVELNENKEFSPTPKEKPVLIRVVAKKTKTNLYETSQNYKLYKAALSKQIDYLKTSLLDLVKFNKLVEDNSIKYTAVGGTLLGLTRHGGAIPWDADIDIGLTEENFVKLMGLKHTFRLRIEKKNKHYHFGTLDIFLLEDKDEWYEGENQTLCHKTEYATLKKHNFGKTYVYAPVNSSKTLERKYGAEYYTVGMVKGQAPFKLVNEDRSCV